MVFSNNIRRTKYLLLKLMDLKRDCQSLFRKLENLSINSAKKRKSFNMKIIFENSKDFVSLNIICARNVVYQRISFTIEYQPASLFVNLRLR